MQGKRRVRDYTREVKDLARKFKEMNERQVVLQLWKGLNTDLRGDMVLLGIKPKKCSLNSMIKMATRCKNSLDQQKQYAKEEQKHQPEGGNNKPKREWTRFKNRNGGNKNFKPGESESAKGSLEKIRANATSPQEPQKDKPKPRANHKKLSRAKMDELRAKGRCFNCREKGHEQ